MQVKVNRENDIVPPLGFVTTDGVVCLYTEEQDVVTLKDGAAMEEERFLIDDLDYYLYPGDTITITL